MEESMYIENLNEFINDENRIVTYRWLSLTLNVSSNVAKQMLFHYYDVHHKKQSSDDENQLSVTYLLSGVKFDEDLNQDIQKICIVHDTELEKVKKSFKQIYSLHIYSIQRVKLKDLHILYGIDYDKIKENVFQSAEYSSISFPTAKVKSDSASRAQINIEPVRKPSPQKNLNIKKEEAIIIDSNKENKKDEKNKPLGSKKDGKGSLATMFANQTKKQEPKRPLEMKKEPNVKSKEGSNAVPKKGSLFNFLTKDKPVKKQEKIPSPKKEKEIPSPKKEKEIPSPKKEKEIPPSLKKEEEIPSPKKSVEENSIKMEVDISDDDDDEEDPKPAPQEVSVRKTSIKQAKPSSNSRSSKRKTNTASKGKRKSSNNSNAKSKRQRIMILDDSSSESSSEEEELIDECPMPSTPPRTIESDDDEDIIPLTPKDSGSSASNKRRKRKLVEKTFEDDQGFLVTKKEYEYVTDSDNENPLPPTKVTRSSPRKSPKKPMPKKSPKKTSPPLKATKKSPVKSKQASIMSFFKSKN